MLKRNDNDRPTKAAFLTLRDEWIDYVNQCPALSHATTRIGTFIALRMNADDQASWWPVKKIAKALGCSQHTVSEAIAQLHRENLLVVHRPNRRSNQTYFLRMPYGVEMQSEHHSVMQPLHRNTRKANTRKVSL